jgi:hypothetical protein
LDTSAGFPEVGNLAVIAAERGDAATFDSLGFTYVPGAVSFGSNWQAGEYLIVGFPGSAKVPSTSSVSADLIGECLKQICLLGRYDAAGLEFIKKVDVPEINAALYVLRVRDASKFPFKSAEEFRRATASASAKK